MLHQWTGLFSVSAIVGDVKLNKERSISSIYGHLVVAVGIVFGGNWIPLEINRMVLGA